MVPCKNVSVHFSSANELPETAVTNNSHPLKWRIPASIMCALIGVPTHFNLAFATSTKLFSTIFESEHLMPRGT